jgi:hypothetical protein
MVRSLMDTNKMIERYLGAVVVDWIHTIEAEPDPMKTQTGRQPHEVVGAPSG